MKANSAVFTSVRHQSYTVTICYGILTITLSPTREGRRQAGGMGPDPRPMLGASTILTQIRGFWGAGSPPLQQQSPGYYSVSKKKRTAIRWRNFTNSQHLLIIIFSRQRPYSILNRYVKVSNWLRTSWSVSTTTVATWRSVSKKPNPCATIFLP